jgi:hypothetical protein
LPQLKQHVVIPLLGFYVARGRSPGPAHHRFVVVVTTITLFVLPPWQDAVLDIVLLARCW